MNNIYKVIWSKAKNCYVVASEIAKSHTKSASGSEKMGGYGKKALLALVAASAIFCGGLVNVGATVHVNEGTGATSEVYTTGETYNKTEVDLALAAKGAANDVASNRTDIDNLKTAVGGLGSGLTKDVADQKADIATNRANINNLDGKLADLTTTVSGKADEAAVTTALDSKADTDLSNLTAAGETKIKDTMSADMANKADVTTVTTLEGRVNGVEGKVTALEGKVGDASSGLVKDVADLKTQGTTLTNALGNKADQSDLDAANEKITKLETKTGNLSTDGKSLTGMDAVSGTTVSGDTVNAGSLNVTGEISNENGVTTSLEKINASMEKTNQNADKVADLEKKTSKIDYDAANDKTTINGVGISNTQVDMGGKDITNARALTATGKVTGDGVDAGTGAITGGSLTVTGKVTGNGVDAGAGDITTTGNVKGGTLETTGNATIGGTLSATGKVTGDGIDAGTGAITGGSLTVTGKVTGNGVDAGAGDITTTGNVKGGTLETTGNASIGGALTATGKVTGDGVDAGTGDITGGSLTVTGKVTGNGVDAGAGDITTTGNVKGGTLETTGDAKIGGDLTVNGKLNVDEISMKNDRLDPNGDQHHSATTITADGISNNAKVTDKNGVTTESKFTHDKEGSTTYAKKSDATNWKESTSNVTADGVSNKMTDSDGNTHTYSQTATESKEQLVNGDKSNFEKKTAEGNTISITEKDADGNLKSSLTNTQTVNGEKTSVTNEDSSSTINQGADQIRYNVTSKDENKTSSSIEVKADGITNTSKDGTITNDAKDIENNATGDITNTAQNGSIINKAENGNISNTAQNVTNEGTESVTNKVGKNEVKVSKDGVNIKAEDGKKITESVGTASRVVENDKITDEAGNSTVTTENGKGTTFGKEGIADTTNIYGDSIKTGTINARDTTTGKLTAGAAADVDGGRLTVDANDGVKGSYKYGDYTSRSYILANTLQSGVDNGKDITDNGFVGSRTDHYMDGDKAKLNETVKDADGSNVTKKTSTKTYTEIKDTNGNTLSVNQKADGNNYKLEDQDGNTNHVTNSATQSKQTLKDKDGNTLTTNQTATKNNFDLKSADGSKENHTTNTVDESRVAIKGENGKAELSTTDEGTTFKHSAAKEAFTEGGATNTTIKGNTITTGKVTMDYADVMKDLGVKGNTTLGEAGKDTTLTVNSKATFNNGLTVTNGETKLKNTTIEGTLNVSENATFQKDVTANSFSVNGKTYIDSDGLNANNQVIRNVADGSISEGSKDAVNGGQLYTVKNDLEGKVNKVGANAAAMANLHPMEFDPASKWNIAAAIGNYGSETAAALGAFYRPNDDVMVNLSTAFGTGENMVGGGVSVRLGKGGNKLSREETNALKAQVADLSARMDALLSVLNPNMSKDFPDVPENHWAYEAVSRLAGNDIVQGYPDGEFHGERTMTRYEMAEIIYNALSRGAEAEKELVEEFKPELQAMAASEKATAERAEG